ncbi:2,3-diphosphoglycerate-dependent phosphoglycerate mutase [Biostraticola tofi]|uniref:2,3-bisphosphoglycerate-dependent phosphoglycerate mutase n=1 Tax=Biostraticola tofi TaxID=466109 RepID=A0A4R3YZS0_9GAMM|nr:2,3-diphosphoglycerate-dependent phosphoglycerate mutase [Biostraticola tofi]TCV98062.1 2,3-bisphosphoglycerate-dependent phosphoglycerate mutase [Biostraticola tofi]
MTIHRVVILRHGESEWNKQNRFTGWTDVDLTAKGRQEAIQAAKLLAASGFHFDFACTSVLKRSIHTLWQVLDELDLCWLPTQADWRLNERHYGALEGLNKAETAERFGPQIVKQWRRSYRTYPPALAIEDQRYPGHDRRYRALSASELPLTESLEATVQRVIAFWHQEITQRLLSHQRILLVSHANAIRALMTYFDAISNDHLSELYIPTGVPLIYEFDDQLKPINHYYLGDRDDIAARISKVKAQAFNRQ